MTLYEEKQFSLTSNILKSKICNDQIIIFYTVLTEAYYVIVL